MKTTSVDSSKIRFIENLASEEYSLYHTYSRIEDVQEVIRMNYCLPCKDMPMPIKVANVDFILFTTKKIGVIVDFVCKENNGTFELYEMSLKAYNEYERYMSDLMTA